MPGRHPAVEDACAAVTRIDFLMVEIARQRAQRDDAVNRALDAAIRPSAIRKETGLSTSMIRLIRSTRARTCERAGILRSPRPSRPLSHRHASELYK